MGDKTCKVGVSYSGKTASRDVTVCECRGPITSLVISGPIERAGERIGPIRPARRNSPAGKTWMSPVWPNGPRAARMRRSARVPLLTTKLVPTDSACKLQAGYGTKKASYSVMIRDARGVLSWIEVVGPGEVPSRTRRRRTPAWSTSPTVRRWMSQRKPDGPKTPPTPRSTRPAS